MISVAMLGAAVMLPQLVVRPVPAVVGEPVEVVVEGRRQLEVSVTLPDGAIQSLGQTDAEGRVRFVPAAIGEHVLVTSLGDVRVIAPFAVVSPSHLGWWSLATAPLALWLLWREISARARGPRRT
ncbi:MAG: hypothetical protein ACK501_01530 [Planctomycetota bacterium]